MSHRRPGEGPFLLKKARQGKHLAQLMRFYANLIDDPVRASLIGAARPREFCQL